VYVVYVVYTVYVTYIHTMWCQQKLGLEGIGIHVVIEHYSWIHVTRPGRLRDSVLH